VALVCGMWIVWPLGAQHKKKTGEKGALHQYPEKDRRKRVTEENLEKAAVYDMTAAPSPQIPHSSISVCVVRVRVFRGEKEARKKETQPKEGKHKKKEQEKWR